MENLEGKDGRYKLRDQENWLMPTCNQMDRTPEGMENRKAYRESIGRHYVEGGLQEQVNNFPTPRAVDVKGHSGPDGLMRKDGKSRMDRLPNAVVYGQPDKDSNNTTGKNRGQLNPAWVEQLMGLPAGWTNFDSWVTELSQRNVKKDL
jgi:hypothetical protein